MAGNIICTAPMERGIQRQVKKAEAMQNLTSEIARLFAAKEERRHKLAALPFSGKGSSCGLSPGDGRSGVARANWAGRLDVKVRSLAVRPMSSKWASCSTAGNLNFNAELLDMDRAVGDYVIVHELLHFSVPHHGKLWKSLMRAHLGDYEKLDRKLKQRD